MEKKNRDKRYTKNWRPISFLNADTKILLKAFSVKLKEVLLRLISSEQIYYVKK